MTTLTYDNEYVNVCNSAETFVMKVISTELEPTIRKGEEIFVDPMCNPEHGDIVVLEHDDWPDPQVKRYTVDDARAAYIRDIVPHGKNTPVPLEPDVELIGVIVFIGRLPEQDWE